MPFSQSTQLSTIVECLEGLAPTSLLDVGTGMGQYGFLARMNLENVNLFDITPGAVTQRARSQWKVRIDGIEGYRNYLTPVHDYIYNNLMVGDAMALLPVIGDGQYEVVMAIDILEHFDKEDGLRFLGELKRIARKAVLVSTPKDFHEQEIDGNPFENHRSHWSSEDLTAAGFGEQLPNRHSWVGVHRIA